MYRNPVDQIVNACLNGIIDRAEAKDYVRKFADAELARQAQVLAEDRARCKENYGVTAPEAA